MKSLLKYILSTIALLFTSTTIMAQKADLEEIFYTGEKYYVVIAVISIIMIGFFVYVFSLDRKIKKIEQQKD